MIFGYLTGALDDDLLNFLDRRIIHWTQSKWQRFKKFFRQVEETAIHHHPPHHVEAMAGIRKEVITQFILTLSDQQLVTGLALLIAGVCNQRTLTGYQFAVLLSQAWFSSTTHMATLDALRNYLGSHGVVRDVRVIGMVSILVLLIYTFIVSLLTRPPRTLMLPVQCLFEEPLYFNPVYASRGGAAAYTLAMIGVTYLFRIQDLYVRQRSPLYFIKWLIWRRRPIGSSYRQYFAEHTARRRFLAACKLAEASWIQRLGYAYGGSFLASIAGIAFSFSYGVAQVVETRWKLSPTRLPAEAGTMSFGQIMPLLLLCLPFLAAGESYYGESSTNTHFTQVYRITHTKYRLPPQTLPTPLRGTRILRRACKTRPYRHKLKVKLKRRHSSLHHRNAFAPTTIRLQWRHFGPHNSRIKIRPRTFQDRKVLLRRCAPPQPHQTVSTHWKRSYRGLAAQTIYRNAISERRGVRETY